VTDRIYFRAWRQRLGNSASWPWLPDSAAGLTFALFLMVPVLAALSVLPLTWLHLRVAQSQTVRQSAGRGFAFALSFFAVHLAWLPQSMATTLGPLGGSLTLLVIPLSALTWTAGLALTRRLAGSSTLLALPFAWVIMEWLRTQGSLAFPWGAPGYALVDTPLAQLASLGGVSLLTFTLTAGASALGYVVAPARRLRGRLAVLFGLLSALTGAAVWGSVQPQSLTTSQTALLVQGNLDPRLKMQGADQDAVNLYLRLTQTALRGQAADLVVWPETAVPLQPTAPVLGAALQRLGAPLILGAPGDVPGQLRNSAYGVTASGVGRRQDKRVLVPFGEQLPFEGLLRPLYRSVLTALGLPGYRSLTPGQLTTVLPVGLVRAGVSICYESVFARLSRQAVQQGANLLIVISNDAWFGTRGGAEQHFQMGRIRAIETRRYLLRAGNDGVSAAIDPWGQVLNRAPRGVQGAFTVAYRLMQDQTPYVRWGEWVGWSSVMVLAGIVLVRRWGPRRKAKHVDSPEA
jgi:apolipoprotein N-acyltransferase